MDLARLVLEYIKTLIWPVLLIVAILAYEKPIFDLLESREIDAFGLKIGSRIENISKNYETEIADLKTTIESGVTDNSRTDLLIKIESINDNIKRDLSQVRNQTIASGSASSTEQFDSSNAAFHERRGFSAILEHDVRRAIESFSEARKAWPEYHNVAELERVLKQRELDLNNALAWKELNQLILQKYSWGMPKDIRQRFKQSLSP